jgi:hypothetical protein
MAAAVDRLAAMVDADDTGPAVDVTFDLAQGLDWVGRACGPERPWFTVGRQYDWLMLARHRLHNAREGSCDRSGAGRWQIGYRDMPVRDGMTVVEQFEHLEIRRR